MNNTEIVKAMFVLNMIQQCCSKLSRIRTQQKSIIERLSSANTMLLNIGDLISKGGLDAEKMDKLKYELMEFDTALLERGRGFFRGMDTLDYFIGRLNKICFESK